MKRLCFALLAFLFLLFPLQVWSAATDLGLRNTKAGETCVQVFANPVQGASFCFHRDTNTLNGWNGAAWVPMPLAYVLPSSTYATLPGSCSAGEIRRLTDNIRGIWECNPANSWHSVTGYADARDWALCDGTNEAVALQAWATAGAGNILFLPEGICHSHTNITIPNATKLIGAGKSVSVLDFPPGVDGLVLGVDDANSTDFVVRDLSITGGRYGLRLNNVQQSIFENLNLAPGTVGIYQEGQLETSVFKNMVITAYTQNGILTGQVNGGADPLYNFPSVQKCLFENIVLAGTGTVAIKLDAGIFGIQRNNNHVTFRHVQSQGTERTLLDTTYTYNLRLEHVHNEIQGAMAANTYSSIRLGVGTGLVSIADSSIVTRANAGGVTKYGIEQLDGYLYMTNSEMIGGVAAGTADIYLAGVGAYIEHQSIYGGVATGIVIANNFVRRQTTLVDIHDAATNLPVTGWGAGTAYLSPNTYPNGLTIGDVYFEGIIRSKLTLAPQAITIPADGTGAHAVYTLTPTPSYIKLNNADTDGATITLSETSAVDGDIVKIVNISANHCDFADTAGVTELNGAYAMGQWQTLTLIYVTDRWVELGRSAN